MSEKNQERSLRIEKMKKMIMRLPFEYLDVKNSEGAVLLKIKNSDHAILVGNDLSERGSSFGINVADEKIFLLCGCESCEHYGNQGGNFEAEILDLAKNNGIAFIIARSRKGGIYKEAEEFISSQEPLATLLNEKKLMPTKRPSKKEIAANKILTNKRRKLQEARSKKREKEEESRKKSDARLLKKALSLQEVSPVLQELINKMSSRVVYEVANSIYHRAMTPGLWEAENNTDAAMPADTKNILGEIEDFNVLTISRHLGKESNFHLLSRQRSIKLKEDGEDNLIFSFQNEIYKVASVRTGLYDSCLVIIAIPENKKYNGRLGGTLEIYTDLPFYKIFATPIEYAILKAKSGAAYDSFEVRLYMADDLELFSQTMRKRAISDMEKNFYRR
ncbi:MAG: hypothetical protein ACD_67C00220G0003 [uncultured bacterium]|nr:MAG: hypothetical protein ACD_67C00220G0003 [uncultured bacterium]